MTEPTGLAVLFPELDAATRAIRSVHDPAHAQGLAPHVTVLYPFLPEAEVTARVRDRLGALFAAHPAFETRFTAPGHFPGVLYLTPEPADPFQSLTEAMARAFPNHPPYAGAHDGTVAHLTLAQGPDLPASGLPTPALPLAARADAVSHLALREGRWYEFARYPLAASGDAR